MRTHVRPSTGVALAAAGLLILSGCTSTATTPSAPQAHPTRARTAAGAQEIPDIRRSSAPVETEPLRPSDLTGKAAILLATLPVKGRAPMSGYSRYLFGESWSDTDGNGCDTRDDVLTRDLKYREYGVDTSCVVMAGELADPYTMNTIHFVRGEGDLVDIDHVVALGNAWSTGAFRWDARLRLQFANDLANLLAVDASANRQKGDGDTATWLPPNKAYRCAYVARQISTKARYGLWVTAPERDAMTQVLAGCPGEGLPPQEPEPAPVQSSGQAHVTTLPLSPSGGYSGSIYFANCDAARAAGAAPVRRGDPGYSTRLDRDGDGTGCE